MKLVAAFFRIESSHNKKERGVPMKMKLPQKVNDIIHTLLANGFEAYAVGGCVRDSVLKKIPQDWDITTSAKPEQVKQIFKRTVDTGIQHGTVTVLLDKEGFEVTTYRIDGEYEDCRRPKEVTFTNDLLEDLKRRDFTVNAMAYNEQEGLIDAFGGVEDIKNKRIRCVGNPEDRFNEDALRMLRAIRFSAQLAFHIEEETRQAIQKLAPNLAFISMERIQAELVKLLESPQPDYLKVAYETGVLAVILPELDELMRCPHKSGTTYGEEALKGLMLLPADRSLRLAVLLQNVAESQKNRTSKKPEEIAKKILKRLRFDNDTLKKVYTLVKYHNITLLPDKCSIRHQLNEIGISQYDMLLTLKRATEEATKAREEELLLYDEVKKQMEEILSDRECVNLKMLAVSGEDLKEMGIKPGIKMGELLQELLFLVLDDPTKNTTEYLKKYCKKRVLSV